MNRDFLHRLVSAAGAIRETGDQRLFTYRTSGGDLMCRAYAGLLSSETPVIPSICGHALGCEGRWSCLTDDADPYRGQEPGIRQKS